MFCTFKYFKGIQPKIWIVSIGCHSIYITSVIYKYCLLKRSRRLNLIAQEYLCYKVRLVTVFRSLFCDVTILPKFVFLRFGSERGDAAAVWHSVCHSPGVKKLKLYARILRCKKKLSKPRCSTATVKSACLHPSSQSRNCVFKRLSGKRLSCGEHLRGGGLWE